MFLWELLSLSISPLLIALLLLSDCLQLAVNLSESLIVPAARRPLMLEV